MTDTERHQKYMHDQIIRVIETIGPRESCSAQERHLAELLANEWKPACDTVETEPFTCHPRAFLGFFPIVVSCYLGALAFYWLFAPISALLATVGVVLLALEFARYRELIDRFFPEGGSQNVIGRIKPRGEIKQRVIVSAHTDSAYEFIIWYLLRKASPFLMVGAGVAAILLFGASVAKSVGLALGSGDAMAFQVLGIICVALYPIVGVFFFFHVGTPVPGALDDMSGLAVMSGLAKQLQEAKSAGKFFPEHTEVMLIAMGCEEAGLRGAKRYVARHLEELRSTPTYGIFLDGIGDERFLTVVSNELCIGARHSPELVRLATEAAAEHGYPILTKMIPLGATDAAAFSLNGIPAVAILNQDVSGLPENYHTRLDTPERVRPEALGVTLRVVLSMIEKLDQRQCG